MSENAITKTDLRTGQRGLVPRNIDEMWRMATMFAASHLVPSHFDTAEKVMVAVQTGLEIGLTPSQALQNLYVVNSRVSIPGETAIALVRQSGVLEYLDDRFEGEEGTDDFAAVIVSKRNDDRHEKVTQFTVAEAKEAGLWMSKTPKGRDTPWVRYPKDMLRWKAYGRHLRLYYPDVLKGLRLREEEEAEVYEAPQIDQSVPRRKDRKPVESRQLDETGEEASAPPEEYDAQEVLNELFSQFCRKLPDHVPAERMPWLWIQFITYVLECRKEDIDAPEKWTPEMLHYLGEAILRPIPEPIQELFGPAKEAEQ